jgi:hypothetical protein
MTGGLSLVITIPPTKPSVLPPPFTQGRLFIAKHLKIWYHNGSTFFVLGWFDEEIF